MPPEAASRYDFRPVIPDDLDRLAGWLRAPHVARWWGDTTRELEEIVAMMDRGPAKPFVILMDDDPIGYIQSYDIHAETDHPYRDQPPGTFGIDLSIGEADLVGRGHGPRIVEAFVAGLFAAGAPRVVIDPDPGNHQAIRAYEKAGFRVVDRRPGYDGAALLMARDAPEQATA